MSTYIVHYCGQYNYSHTRGTYDPSSTINTENWHKQRGILNLMSELDKEVHFNYTH